MDENTKSKEAMESLIANLFTSISAIKASYAQIQVAQSPYDPETIQSADISVANEFKLLSQLKHSYLKNQLGPLPPPPLAAQIQEHRNLIKTYQITIKKLESDIQHKSSEISDLHSELMEYEHQNRALESKLNPEHSLSALDDLHLSGLDPTHFLVAVKYTMKSIKSFVKLMIGEMESAGWDLDAAAKSIQPNLLKKSGHRVFAFESFVCQKLFSNFHNQDFGFEHLEEQLSWDKHKFFKEFMELKSAKAKQLLSSQKRRSSWFGGFCRAKYLTIVHPKMEASFFGDLDERGFVSSSHEFPKSEFFLGFAEMARRVWLLHCLFFSFDREKANSIFQIRKGCRFSEVYMESVIEESSGANPVVGFTVVPGFKIGRTVIQSKVYIS